MTMFRTVKFTDEAMNDAKLVADIVDVAIEHGYEVTEAFTISDAMIAKKGFDEAQFTIPKAKHIKLFDIISWGKPSIKL